jgi:hypothetical protein
MGGLSGGWQKRWIESWPLQVSCGTAVLPQASNRLLTPHGAAFTHAASSSGVARTALLEELYSNITAALEERVIQRLKVRAYHDGALDRP